MEVKRKKAGIGTEVRRVKRMVGQREGGKVNIFVCVCVCVCVSVCASVGVSV